MQAKKALVELFCATFSVSHGWPRYAPPASPWCALSVLSAIRIRADATKY
jgi:hypothetical protein